MKKMNIKKARNIYEMGFSLVEMLVVIVIISILTLITVTQFQSAKRKGNDIQRKTDLSSVSKALLMYYADYGLFPASSNGRLTNGAGVQIDWGQEFRDAVATPYVYMKVLPKENTNPVSSPYCYKTSLDFKKFALFARLENTDDRDCTHSYLCNGVTYCYGIVSPNSSLNANGDLL